jgi:hypothetical protein
MKEKKMNRTLKQLQDAIRTAPVGGLIITPEEQEILNAAPLPPKSNLETQIGGGHYKNKGIQPVEFTHSNDLPFLEGCIVKRVARHAEKNGLEDIKKIIHEAKLIAELTYGVIL